MKQKSVFLSLLTLLWLIANPVLSSAKEKVILSSDMIDFFDDGVAMLLLAKNPEIELLGVATVIGNSWVEAGTASAIRQLEGINRTDIPVFCGINNVTHAGRFENISLEKELCGSGHDNFNGAADLPQPESWKVAYKKAYKSEPSFSPQNKHAVNFIIDAVKANPGEITFIAIGTYNNLAAAVRIAPEIVPLFKRVIYMGGAFFCEGNATACAELNLWLDPESARYVWRQPFREQVIFPLDCCNKIRFTKSRFESLTKLIKSDILKNLLPENQYTLLFKNNPQSRLYIWDVLCAAYINDPAIIEEEVTHPVDVIAAFGPSYGKSIAYKGVVSKGAQKARIILKVNEEKIWNQLEKLFSSL